MESRKARKRKINNVHKDYQKRIYTMAIIFSLFLVALIGRLFFIQIIKGNDYHSCAKNQWFKEIPVGIKRGKIYDRNRRLLTNREEKKYLIIYPEYFLPSDENMKIISDITKVSPYELKNRKLTRNRSIKLEIKNDEKEFIKKAMNIKGVYPIEYNNRYGKKSIAAHVIGYINKIDNTGKKGIEKMYDELLKENQIAKVNAVVVDAQKKIIPGLGYKRTYEGSNEKGKNIVTTLDERIQKIAEEELEKLHKNGSVVVLDAKSGEIVAMVSRPNFDQNNVAAYLQSNNKELYNRAIQIGYPPGSIFKIIVTAAALENEIKEDYFFCKGYEEIEGTTIKCWRFDKGGHGELNLEQAFAVSCNAAFIQLGQKVGGEKIVDMAKKFGLGSKTDIGVYEEIPGRLPSEEYMKGAGIGNISIGQGTLEVTPLQIAKATAIIANGGIDKGVYLIKEIIDDDGKLIKKNEKRDPKRVISYDTAKKIQKMMEKVVVEGTARNKGLGKTCGKTGSAQAKSNGKEIVHAWFTGFFPGNDPKYVIAIVVEDGISGGKSAVPIFRNIKNRI